MIHGRSILTVTNEIRLLPAIQSFAREFAREIGFGPDDQEKILLALEEAVANVIEHAFESAEQSFQIVFEPSAGGMKIVVKDKGLPYDPTILPEYEASEDIDEVPEHGLGSLIMKKCVDEVSFYNLGREGKELHLTKLLPVKNVVEHGVATEPAAEAPINTIASSSPPAIEFRLMKQSEALEVSRLFYRTYGYSYLSDVMYYPERLAEHNREGLINSVVAVTEHGEIAGHLAMVRDTLQDALAETGKGAVNESYRGLDLFTKMQEFLTAEAKTIGIKGLYGRAVTVHTFSQKMTEKTGFKDCGVILGCAPAGISFKGIADETPQRETLVCSFQAVVQLPVTSVYLPSRHEAILRKIYSNLGLTRNFEAVSGDIRLAELTTLKVKVSHEANSAEIYVDQYGEDCVRVLRSHIRDLCSKKVDHITLFLDLAHPATRRMCPEIEKLGFFLAGILPYRYFEDTLMLQYLNNVILDYSRIKIHSDMAREMIAYIEASGQS